MLFVLFLGAVSMMAQTTASKQREKADYIWAIDVSGGSNIYLADVQTAIDSFYVKATCFDDLNVIRYAASVIGDSTIMDDEFYKHSDQRAMLNAVCDAIGNSKNRTVRVYVLSDFCNDTPLEGSCRLLTDSLLTIRQKFMTFSSNGKDVKVTMLILPPSTSPTGYSLDSIKAVMPEDVYNQFFVSSSDSLQSFIMNEIDSLNVQLKHVDNETPSWASQHSTLLMIISIIVIIIIAGGFFAYRKRQKWIPIIKNKFKR